MSKTVHKVLSKGGGLTIPAEIRREYGFQAGDAVDITLNDGQLVVSQHTPRCMFCGNTENIGKHMGRHVCRPCVATMTKEVGTDG